MSTILIGLLVFLELIGFSTSQKDLEGIADKVGFSDPFGIGSVRVKELGIFEKNVLENNLTKNQNTRLANISILNVNPFPRDVARAKPKILAKAAYMYDLKSNRTLFSKNPEDIRPIASVTKIMTSIVIMENENLNEVVTVAPSASWVTGSKMHLYPNEKIKVKELLYGMLIKSANDAAKALEAHLGRDELVRLMNEKAEWLGLSDTKFTESSGLDQEDASSARDLAIISGYALKNKNFKNIIKKKQYTASSADGKIEHPMNTTNRLLKNYPDIFGLKTGYTNEAGYCLISLAKQRGHQVVAIVLGSQSDDSRFDESRKLLDWAFSAYEW